MTRLFDQESGAMVPVTVIDVKGNTFAQIKTEDKDGYNAIQVAFDAQKESRVAKPQAGHFKKLGIQPTKLLKEFRGSSELPAKARRSRRGSLSAGQWVDVIGTSKAKGSRGVRRHNFHGSPAAHGSMMHRRTGVWWLSTPGRVWKNQKMPDRWAMPGARSEPEGCGCSSGRQCHPYLRRRSGARFLPRDPPRQEEVRL
ncbi:MAG: large ribosomal subunit protein uL3 [Akkermansia muciniphila]